MTWKNLFVGIVLVSAVLVLAEGHSTGAPRATVVVRGHTMTPVESGPPSGRAVILSSGDGGWIHLAPHVAAVLAAQGFHVIGFNTRAYLEAFTTAAGTLSEDDVRADYEVLVDYARRASTGKPLLIGVSEGAGLSVLAATGRKTRDAVAGVVGLGMPNVNELAWRWKDAAIYLSHGVPHEPQFRVAGLVSSLGELPLAAVHSTNDEFASADEARRILDLSSGPHRFWSVAAGDHRFSDNLAGFDMSLLNAIAWVRSHDSH